MGWLGSRLYAKTSEKEIIFDIDGWKADAVIVLGICGLVLGAMSSYIVIRDYCK